MVLSSNTGVGVAGGIMEMYHIQAIRTQVQFLWDARGEIGEDLYCQAPLDISGDFRGLVFVYDKLLMEMSIALKKCMEMIMLTNGCRR